ncbi:MAG: ABC transporter substrate-binding protein [Cyanobacteria bacterium J06641_5]
MQATKAPWQQLIGLSVCLTLCTLLLLGLASCATNPPNTNTDAGPLHLTLWHGINPPANRDVFNDLVAEFNRRHADIDIEALYIGQPDGQLPKILTAIVGDVPPDLLWFVPQLTGQLVELDAIRPIDDWLAQSPHRQDLDPALLETMSLGEHLWSVPFATNNAAIFYRPSLFAAAGIDRLPATWDELQDTARRLTADLDGDGRSDRYGMFLSVGKGEWTVFVWLPFLFGAGGELVTPDGQPNLSNPGAIAALSLGTALVQSGWATLSAPERGFELDEFLAGRAAMQVTGPWTLGQLQQTDIDYGVFPFPARNQHQSPAAVVGGENLFVMKTTPERERAAWEFCEYVLSEEFQTAWALGTGYLPANLSSRQSNRYQEFVEQNPVLKVFLEQMNVARSRPIVPGYARLSENFGRAIESALLSRDTPTEALAASQRRLDLAFSR